MGVQKKRLIETVLLSTHTTTYEYPQHMFRLRNKIIYFWYALLTKGLTHSFSCSVRPSTFSNIFSSETTGPIKLKFHMETILDAGTKVCSNGPGHMTKMAAMPIYGKKLLKSSSPEPEGQ